MFRLRAGFGSAGPAIPRRSSVDNFTVGRHVCFFPCLVVICFISSQFFSSSIFCMLPLCSPRVIRCRFSSAVLSTSLFLSLCISLSFPFSLFSSAFLSLSLSVLLLLHFHSPFPLPTCLSSLFSLARCMLLRAPHVSIPVLLLAKVFRPKAGRPSTLRLLLSCRTEEVYFAENCKDVLHVADLYYARAVDCAAARYLPLA